MVLSFGVTASMAQAPASSPDTRHRPFNLTVGGLIPFSGDAVKLGGVVYTGVGLSYFPTRSAIPAKMASGSRLGLRADYVRGQSSIGEVTSAGISPVYQRVAGTFRGNRLIYGLGLGLFHTHVRDSEMKTSDNSVGLGGRLSAGMEFSNNILVDLSYSELPGALGAHPRGFALQIGTRF